MTDDILDKYVKRRNGKEQSPADENDTIEVPGFGWLRGIRDAANMLEIRHRDGHISAFSYNMLDQADFDPSDGITLHFAKSTVHIIGRNLNVEARPHLRLFEGITRRRVTWIQVANEPTAMEGPKDAVVIEAVEVK
jgi:hypothetical protein